MRWKFVTSPISFGRFFVLFFAGRRLSFLEKCGFLQCHSDSVDEEDRFERSTFVHQFISDSSLQLFVTKKSTERHEMNSPSQILEIVYIISYLMFPVYMCC